MATCPSCGATYEGVQFCSKDGARLVADANPVSRIGEIVGERYRLIEKAGEGGMGEVFRAEHIYIQRQVALKLLRRELAAHAEAIQRLQREAHATSGIGHPNIVHIEDFGHLSDGTVFLAMEWLDGETMDELLETGKLDLRRGLRLAIQVCNGLSAAHSSGVVHRDLKPANIFISTDEDGADIAKLLDFGIARLMDTDSDLTKSGTFVGTPHYMPPEQARGQPVTAAGDIYSMGVILYELATGCLPFESDTFMGVLHKKTSAPPELPSGRAPDRGIPASLETTIMRALQMFPETRHSSIDEVEAELEATLAELSDEPSKPSKRTTMPGIAAQRAPKAAPIVPTVTRPIDAPPQSARMRAAQPVPTPLPPTRPVSRPITAAEHPASAMPEGSTPVSMPIPSATGAGDSAAPPMQPPSMQPPPREPSPDAEDSLAHTPPRRGKILFVVVLICLLGGAGAAVTLLLVRDTNKGSVSSSDAGAAESDAATIAAAIDATPKLAAIDAGPAEASPDASATVVASTDASVEPVGGVWRHRTRAKNVDVEVAVSPRPVKANSPVRIAGTLSNAKGRLARARAAGGLSAKLMFSYYKGHKNYPGPSVDIDASGHFEIEWTPPQDGKYHVYVSLMSGAKRLAKAKYDMCVGADPNDPAETLRTICPTLNPGSRPSDDHDH